MPDSPASQPENPITPIDVPLSMQSTHAMMPNATVPAPLPPKKEEDDFDPMLNQGRFGDKVTLSNGKFADRRFNGDVLLHRGNTDDPTIVKGWYRKDANGVPYRVPEKEQKIDLASKFGEGVVRSTLADGTPTVMLKSGRAKYFPADKTDDGVAGFYTEDGQRLDSEGFFHSLGRGAKAIAGKAVDLVKDAYQTPSTHLGGLSAQEIVNHPIDSMSKMDVGQAVRAAVPGPLGGIVGIVDRANSPQTTIEDKVGINALQGAGRLGREGIALAQKAADAVFGTTDSLDERGKKAHAALRRSFADGTLPYNWGTEEAKNWALHKVDTEDAQRKLADSVDGVQEALQSVGINSLDDVKTALDEAESARVNFEANKTPENSRILSEKVRNFLSLKARVETPEFRHAHGQAIRAYADANNKLAELNQQAKADGRDQMLQDIHSGQVASTSEWLGELFPDLALMGAGGAAALKIGSKVPALAKAVKAYEAANQVGGVLPKVLSGAGMARLGVQSIHTLGQLTPGAVRQVADALVQDKSVSDALGTGAIDTLKAFPAFLAMNSGHLKGLTTILNPKSAGGAFTNGAVRTFTLASINTLAEGIAQKLHTGGDPNENIGQFWRRLAELGMFEAHGAHQAHEMAKASETHFKNAKEYADTVESELAKHKAGMASGADFMKTYGPALDQIRSQYKGLASYIDTLQAGQTPSEDLTKAMAEDMDRLGSKVSITKRTAHKANVENALKHQAWIKSQDYAEMDTSSDVPETRKGNKQSDLANELQSMSGEAKANLGEAKKFREGAQKSLLGKVGDETSEGESVKSEDAGLMPETITPNKKPVELKANRTGRTTSLKDVDEAIAAKAKERQVDPSAVAKLFAQERGVKRPGKRDREMADDFITQNNERVTSDIQGIKAEVKRLVRKSAARTIENNLPEKPAAEPAPESTTNVDSGSGVKPKSKPVKEIKPANKPAQTVVQSGELNLRPDSTSEEAVRFRATLDRMKREGHVEDLRDIKNLSAKNPAKALQAADDFAKAQGWTKEKPKKAAAPKQAEAYTPDRSEEEAFLANWDKAPKLTKPGKVLQAVRKLKGHGQVSESVDTIGGRQSKWDDYSDRRHLIDLAYLTDGTERVRNPRGSERIFDDVDHLDEFGKASVSKFNLAKTATRAMLREAGVPSRTISDAEALSAGANKEKTDIHDVHADRLARLMDLVNHTVADPKVSKETRDKLEMAGRSMVEEFTHVERRARAIEDHLDALRDRKPTTSQAKPLELMNKLEKHHREMIESAKRFANGDVKAYKANERTADIAKSLGLDPENLSDADRVKIEKERQTLFEHAALNHAGTERDRLASREEQISTPFVRKVMKLATTPVIPARVTEPDGTVKTVHASEEDRVTDARKGLLRAKLRELGLPAFGLNADGVFARVPEFEDFDKFVRSLSHDGWRQINGIMTADPKDILSAWEDAPDREQTGTYKHMEPATKAEAVDAKELGQVIEFLRSNYYPEAARDLDRLRKSDPAAAVARAREVAKELGFDLDESKAPLRLHPERGLELLTDHAKDVVRRDEDGLTTPELYSIPWSSIERTRGYLGHRIIASQQPDLLRAIERDVYPMPASYLKEFGRSFKMNLDTRHWAHLMDNPVILAEAVAQANGNSRAAELLKEYRTTKGEEKAEAYEDLRKHFLAVTSGSNRTDKINALGKYLHDYIESPEGHKAAVKALSEKGFNGKGVRFNWDGQGTEGLHPIPTADSIFDMQSDLFSNVMAGQKLRRPNVSADSLKASLAPEVAMHVSARPAMDLNGEKIVDEEGKPLDPEVDLHRWIAHTPSDRNLINQAERRRIVNEWTSKLKGRDFKAGDTKVEAYEGDPALHRGMGKEAEAIRENWKTKIDGKLRTALVERVARNGNMTNAQAWSALNAELGIATDMSPREVNDLLLKKFYDTPDRPTVKLDAPQNLLKRNGVSDLRKDIPLMSERLRVPMLAEANQDSLMKRIVDTGLVQYGKDGVLISRLAGKTNIDINGTKVPVNDGQMLIDAINTVSNFENFQKAGRGFNPDRHLKDTELTDEFGNDVSVSLAHITGEMANQSWFDDRMNEKAQEEATGNLADWKTYRQAQERIVQILKDYGILKPADFMTDYKAIGSQAASQFSKLKAMLTNAGDAGREALARLPEVLKEVTDQGIYADRFVNQKAQDAGESIELDPRMEAAKRFNIAREIFERMKDENLPEDARAFVEKALAEDGILNHEGMDILHKRIQDMGLTYQDKSRLGLRTASDGSTDLIGRDQLSALVNRNHPLHELVAHELRGERGMKTPDGDEVSTEGIEGDMAARSSILSSTPDYETLLREDRFAGERRRVPSDIKKLITDGNIQAMRGSETFAKDTLDYLEKNGYHNVVQAYHENLAEVRKNLTGMLDSPSKREGLQYGSSAMRFLERLDPLMVAQLHFKDVRDGGLASYVFGHDTIQLSEAYRNLLRPTFNGDRVGLASAADRAVAFNYVAHELGHWLSEYVSPDMHRSIDDAFWSGRTKYGQEHAWFNLLFGKDSVLGDGSRVTGQQAILHMTPVEVSEWIKANKSAFPEQFRMDKLTMPDGTKLNSLRFQEGNQVYDVLTPGMDGTYSLTPIDFEGSYRYINHDEYFAEGIRQVMQATARRAMPGLAGDVEGMRLSSRRTEKLKVLFSREALAEDGVNVKHEVITSAIVRSMAALNEAGSPSPRNLRMFADLFTKAPTGMPFVSTMGYRIDPQTGIPYRTNKTLGDQILPSDVPEEVVIRRAVQKLGTQQLLSASKQNDRIPAIDDGMTKELVERSKKYLDEKVSGGFAAIEKARGVKEAAKWFVNKLAADAATINTRRLANILTKELSEFKAHQTGSQMLAHEAWKEMDKVLKPTLTRATQKAVAKAFEADLAELSRTRTLVVDGKHQNVTTKFKSWDDLLVENKGDELATQAQMLNQLNDFGLVTKEGRFKARMIMVDNHKGFWGKEEQTPFLVIPDSRGEAGHIVSEQTMDAYDYLQSYGRVDPKTGEPLPRTGGNMLSDKTKAVLDTFIKRAQAFHESNWEALLAVPDIDHALLKDAKREAYFPNIHKAIWPNEAIDKDGAFDPIADMHENKMVNVDRLKERVYKDAREAAQHGFLPKYANPIDAWLQGGKQFRKMVVFRKFLSDLESFGLARYDHPTASEKGWTRMYIDRDGSLVNQRLADKGTADMPEDPKGQKYFYVHDEMMPVLNSTFGKGFSDKTVFRNAMRINHVLSPLMLGFSGFHVSNTVGYLGAMEAMRSGGIGYYQQLREAGVGKLEATKRAASAVLSQYKDSLMNQRGKEFMTNFGNFGHLGDERIKDLPDLTPIQKATLIMAKHGHYDPRMNPQYEQFHRVLMGRLVEDMKQGNALSGLAKLPGLAGRGWMTGNELVQSAVMRKVNNAKASHIVNAYENYLTTKMKKEGWKPEELVDRVINDLNNGDIRRKVVAQKLVKSWAKGTGVQRFDVTKQIVPDPKQYKTGEIAEYARRVTSHMDQIFGMVNYDALFMDPKMKHLLMLKDLAFGWKQGNFSLFGKSMDNLASGIDNALGNKFGYVKAKKALGGTGYADSSFAGFSGLHFLGSAAIFSAVYNTMLRAIGIARPMDDWKDREGNFGNKTFQALEDLIFPALGDKLNQNGEYQRYAYGYNKELWEMMFHPSKAAEYLLFGGTSPLVTIAKDMAPKLMGGSGGINSAGQPLYDPRFLPEGARQAVNEFSDEHSILGLPVKALAELGNRALPISATSMKQNLEQGMNPVKAFVTSQAGMRTTPVGLGINKSNATVYLENEARKGFTGTDRTWETQMSSEKLNAAIRVYVNSNGQDTSAFDELQAQGFSPKKIAFAKARFADFNGEYTDSSLDHAIKRVIQKNKLAVATAALKASDNELYRISQWIRADMRKNDDSWRALEVSAKHKIKQLQERIAEYNVDHPDQPIEPLPLGD